MTGRWRGGGINGWRDGGVLVGRVLAVQRDKWPVEFLRIYGGEEAGPVLQNSSMWK